MDFEYAAQRLQRDQSKLKGRGKVELSAKAAREAAFRKKQQQKLAEERARKLKRQEAMESYMRQCERSLRVKPLISAPDGSGLQLKATSIHGQGDKIALPPSVLETLTQSMENDSNSNSNSNSQQQPWTFRIGILNPEYTYPASPVLQTLPLSTEQEEDGAFDDDEDEDESSLNHHTAAYLDELEHKYLAYTHGTVVEFTQEEGHVGLPEPISKALLSQAKTTVQTTRTVDKAAAAEAVDDNSMEVDDEKTPGHLAWGAFDVPVAEIEITLVQLPKGRTAKLLPTEEAINNGFYSLKDIKLVLEQSLIRTRATLTVQDLIHTWHRGTKYDLTVTDVSPATYNSVSCINTDIEIEFEEAKDTRTTSIQKVGHPSSAPAATSLGRRLDEPSSAVAPASPAQAVSAVAADLLLLPEPPLQQKEGVVVVQIRADGAKGQRRFDIQTATVSDLFAFAKSLGVPEGFQLVTRFPRHVLSLGDGTTPPTLQEAGVAAGQELYLVEKI